MSRLFILLCCSCCLLASAVHSANRPNILLIFTDDQGYYDVSYYGKEDIETPVLDGLAEAGMRFDSFYANCPVCSPSRAALLTGRQQDLVGVPGVIRDRLQNSWGYWDPNSTSLATVLADNGYEAYFAGYVEAVRAFLDGEPKNFIGGY